MSQEGDWISFDQWPRCQEMERPGIVSEIRNAEAQLLTTRCVVPRPEFSFDGKPQPLEFRAVASALGSISFSATRVAFGPRSVFIKS